MKTVCKVLGLFLVSALVLASGERYAQGYPNRPIKFVTGNPPGGGEDELWDSICLCGRRICFCRLRPTYKASDIGLIMGLVGSSSFVIFNRFSTISSEQATRWLGFS